MAAPTSVGSAKLAVVEPPKLSAIELYSRVAFAGAVCCSVTHGGLTPVDVYVVACSF
jgi:solute carrier family 25 phosphate transporter 3